MQNDDFNNLSIDEINELYSDIIELPDNGVLSAYVNCNTCNTTPGYHYSSPTSPQK